MARNKAFRKYQLTINNPLEHGYSHEQIKNIMDKFSGLCYWCMGDEIGECKTPHTHIYLFFKNAVMFETIQSKFYGAHIECANGSHRENRDYIKKEGKWHDDPKQDTSLPGSFEESGEIPAERAAINSETAEIYQMIKDGCSDFEIMEQYPSAMNKLTKIIQARQIILQQRYKAFMREITVTYLWGDSGSGKTSGIYKRHGYMNVYRVTDYQHPFDGYQCEPVIVFEEFRSSIPLAIMLSYIDIHPLTLPSRYSNRTACYTTVYIVSNIPLEEQYVDVQRESPESYKAWRRRIHHVERKFLLNPIGEMNEQQWGEL